MENVIRLSDLVSRHRWTLGGLGGSLRGRDMPRLRKVVQGKQAVIFLSNAYCGTVGEGCIVHSSSYSSTLYVCPTTLR